MLGPLAVALLWASPGIWIDVPFVAQTEEGCGAAAAAMVLRYWGAEADPDSILRRLYSKDLHGIRAADLAAYLRERGLRVFEFAATPEDLAAHLAKGRPLIVALHEGRAALHYVVVAGVDARTVLVNDPARRKLLKIGRADFERRWMNRWALLAIPGGTR